MNYSEMSDFEINKQVAKALGLDFSGVTEESRHMYNIMDYCNSWADAGPIILENSIGLIAPFTGFEPEGFARWDAYDPMSQCRAFSHENPLRAAMIVFLMMQEEK